MTKTYNIISHGDVVNTNGVLSNFSVTNYATLPEVYNISGSNWEVNLRLTTGDNINITQGIFMPLNADKPVISLCYFLRKKGAIGLDIYAPDMSVLAEPEFTCTANTRYDIKIKYTNNVIYCTYSTDGITYKDFDVTSQVEAPNGIGTTTTLFAFGNARATDRPFYGTIDLSGCNLIINNQLVWRGITTTGTTRIVNRHDTASIWTAVNPVLAAGEMGVETDTNKFKFGDGTTAWSGLAYAAGEGGGDSYTKAETDSLLNAKQDKFDVGTSLTLEKKINKNENIELVSSSTFKRLTTISSANGSSWFPFMNSADNNLSIPIVSSGSNVLDKNNILMYVGNIASNNTFKITAPYGMSDDALVLGTLNSDGTFNPKISSVQFNRYNYIFVTLSNLTLTNNSSATYNMPFGWYTLPTTEYYDAGRSSTNPYVHELTIAIDSSGYLVINRKFYDNTSTLLSDRTFTSTKTKFDELNLNACLFPTMNSYSSANYVYELSGVGVFNGSEQIWSPVSSSEIQILEANTATTSSLGVVQPDGTSITVSEAGVISGQDVKTFTGYSSTGTLVLKSINGVLQWVAE